MKKNALLLSIIFAAYNSFACPACEGLYKDTLTHEQETSHSLLKTSNSDHSINTGDFKNAMFELSYDTPLWQKELGQNAIFPFFDYENNGNLKLNAAIKLQDKHTVTFQLRSGLNLIPSIYDNKKHSDNLKDFYNPYIKAINKKYETADGFHMAEKIEATTELTRRTGGDYYGDMKVVTPIKANFKDIKLGYEYAYNDEFKVNTTFTIDGHSNYKLSLNPSYEFAKMLPENEYVKVKSLKFVPSYSYAVKYDKKNFGKKQNRVHSAILGADAKFTLPMDVQLGLDLKNFYKFEVKYNKSGKFDYHHSGEAKISLAKNFNLYEEGKHKLVLENNVSWKPEWVWNAGSRKIKRVEVFNYVLEKEIEHNYPTNFISDRIEASTKLGYTYKINDDFSVNSSLKVKYDGYKDYEKKDSKRENKFKPTAHVGVKYNHKFNEDTTVYGELNADFTSKDVIDKKLYLIEPSAKIGIRYSY